MRKGSGSCKSRPNDLLVLVSVLCKLMDRKVIAIDWSLAA
jgi:hypothetical protein